MAIYILFQCCKCFCRIRLHLYSCSPDKNDIRISLCKHFDIIYSYKCKWGFFTLGWNIVLDLKVKCRKCHQKYYNFGSTTFNAEYYELDTHHICCNNVFILSVSGNNFACDGIGFLLQQEQDEISKKIKKELNNEKRENILYQKDLNVKNLLDMKKSEKKQKKISCNTNYIETDLKQLLNHINYQIQKELSFEIEETINETSNFTFNKSAK